MFAPGHARRAILSAGNPLVSPTAKRTPIPRDAGRDAFARFASHQPLERQKIHHLTRLHAALFVVQDDEAVGLAHGAQDARALIAGGACSPAAVRLGLEHGALVFGAARALADRVQCAHRQQWLRLGASVHHAQQRLAHEGVKGHHDRHRVARQAEQHRCVHPAGDAAESHGAAGAHRDAPEGYVAEFGHDGAQMVGFAHRHAAGGDDGVGVFANLAQRGFEQRGIVAHHAEVEHVAAQAREHGPEGVAIAVVHAALRGWLAQAAQFVPSGHEGHAQLAPHHYFR